MFYCRIFPNWSNIDRRTFNYIPIGPFNSEEEAESWYWNKREEHEKREGSFYDMDMDIVEDEDGNCDDSFYYEHEKDGIVHKISIPVRNPSVVDDDKLWEEIEEESAFVIFNTNY